MSNENSNVYFLLPGLNCGYWHGTCSQAPQCAIYIPYAGVICDQIRLWEIERDRFLFTEGMLYNQFLSQKDFELLRYGRYRHLVDCNYMST